MQKIITIFLMTIFTLSINMQASAEDKFPTTDSPSIILIDSKTGQILYEKNSHKKLYPASITKVMTALLTLEKCKLDEKVTASKKAVWEIERGSSNVGFSPGEELTVEQLIYALMLESANEAANILAEHIGGSIEGFAAMMNARAKELGALDTHFVTTNGLHKDDHYTTVYDMSLIAKQAMTMPVFRKITKTTKYNMPNTNVYTKGDKVFFNHNKLILRGTSYFYPYATGIKTGYTTKARHSLVSSASQNGIELIAVSMNAKIMNGVLQTYTDSTKLFDYVFNNYSMQEPIKAGNLVSHTSITNTKNQVQLDIIAENDVCFLFPNALQKGYTTNQVINSDLKAPIQKGSIVGSIEYLFNGAVIGKTNLTSGNNIDASGSSKSGVRKVVGTIFSILKAIIIAALVIFVCLIIWLKIRRRTIIKRKKHLLKIEKLMRD